MSNITNEQSAEDDKTCVVMEPTMSRLQRSIIYEFNNQVVSESRRVSIDILYVKSSLL